MADSYPKEIRSKVMRQVKGQNTSPELLLRRSLYASGVRGWRCHRKDIPGKPDIAFIGKKLAVFMDGAFWHGHPSKYWQGRSGTYWDTKIARNQARDRRVDEELAKLGWRVFRVWDFEIKSNIDLIVQSITDILASTTLQSYRTYSGNLTEHLAAEAIANYEVTSKSN